MCAAYAYAKIDIILHILGVIFQCTWSKIRNPGIGTVHRNAVMLSYILAQIFCSFGCGTFYSTGVNWWNLSKAELSYSLFTDISVA